MNESVLDNDLPTPTPPPPALTPTPDLQPADAPHFIAWSDGRACLVLPLAASARGLACHDARSSVGCFRRIAPSSNAVHACT